MSSAMVTNHNQNVKNPMQNGYFSTIIVDENLSLFLNLSQHGLQIASDIGLIIKE